MFENLFDAHQATSETVAPYIRRALPRKHVVVMKRAHPRVPEQKGCCSTCRDKVTQMNGVEIKGVCTSANCPLGE